MIPTETIRAFLQELVKIAQESKQVAPETALGAFGVLGGGGALLTTPLSTRSRLGGYKRVYHGTTPDAAAGIRAEGLQRRFGGTGIAAADVLAGHNVGDRARENVYFTPKKGVGEDYVRKASHTKNLLDTGYSRAQLMGIESVDDYSKMRESIAKALQKTEAEKAKYRSGLAKIDLPMEMWERAKTDPLPAKLESEQAAMILSEDIDPKFIHGGGGRAREILRRTMRIPQYAVKYPKRFLKGVGGVAPGLGLLGGGAALIHRGLTNRTEEVINGTTS